MKKILVIRATGQIGMELVPALRTGYGTAHVVATITKTPPEIFLTRTPGCKKPYASSCGFR